MVAKKVLIRGAGDLASGIALRLHRCGFLIAMTEQSVPTTVRRNVAFSPAIYEKKACVEGVVGVRCRNQEELVVALSQNNIGVFQDESASMRHWWKPDVIVDAILAKKNLGTTILDAPVVIGVGPGFVAGVDCHVVVESKRGHTLGRCIWEGSAIRDTGVPGIIGGYGVERVTRGTGEGKFLGKVALGDLVKVNDLIGFCGETPVYAAIEGLVRGLLQDGVVVYKGMKIGDIDPRGSSVNYEMVSDKASAIAGGVLEGILMSYEW